MMADRMLSFSSRSLRPLFLPTGSQNQAKGAPPSSHCRGQSRRSAGSAAKTMPPLPHRAVEHLLPRGRRRRMRALKTRIPSPIVRPVPLGDRLTVGRVALDHLIGVRIPVSQPFPSGITFRSCASTRGISAPSNPGSGSIRRRRGPRTSHRRRSRGIPLPSTRQRRPCSR